MMASKLLKDIRLSGDDVTIQDGRLIINAPATYLSDYTLIKLKHEKDILIKVLELEAIIKQVSINFGGDDPVFLAEYIDNVTCEWSHDLDKALSCFRDLLKQIPSVNNRK